MRLAAAEARHPVYRFAPSPNGPLHLGHAYSALLNETLARRDGGSVLLRMEDIDVERCRPAFADWIEEDLAWLGLAWPVPILRQSTRQLAYRAALETLSQHGLLYPCFCSRGQIRDAVRDRPDWPSDPDGSPLYPGTCRTLTTDDCAKHEADGRRPALRLDMAKALADVEPLTAWQEYGEANAGETRRAAPAVWGDVILARRDIGTSYHLAVVVDDAAQGVTDVVRGRDLLAATPLQRLLQMLLALPEPRYHHHRLLEDERGRKLSKSQAATGLRELRAAGRTAASIRAELGFAPSP